TLATCRASEIHHRLATAGGKMLRRWRFVSRRARHVAQVAQVAQAAQAARRAAARSTAAAAAAAMRRLAPTPLPASPSSAAFSTSVSVSPLSSALVPESSPEWLPPSGRVGWLLGRRRFDDAWNVFRAVMQDIRDDPSRARETGYNV